MLKENGHSRAYDSFAMRIYDDQEATVRTIYGNTAWFKIIIGVRKGCILSPYLFNLYNENIISRSGLDEIEHGVRISGRNITNLWYADDTTLLAETEEGLKMLLTRIKKKVRNLVFG